MSVVSKEPCRIDTGCWRPLCPCGHSGRGGAARWAALWSLLAKQEVEDYLEGHPSGRRLRALRGAECRRPMPPVVAVVEITPEEHISERTQIVDVPVPLDQPGDQACRPAGAVHRQGYCRRACCDTATGSVTIAHTDDQARRDSSDTVHRQGCCRAYCDTATGPSDSHCAKDGRSSAGAVHRQFCGRPFDQPDQPGDQARRDFADLLHFDTDTACQPCCRRACCDTATGPSDTDGFEDCESPAGAAHRIPAVDEPDPPSQEEIDVTIKLFPVERIPERNGDHLVDVPVPQTSEEVAEVVKAVKKAPLKRISEKMMNRSTSPLPPTLCLRS